MRGSARHVAAVGAVNPVIESWTYTLFVHAEFLYNSPMRLTVEVRVVREPKPPTGAPVIVQVRDTRLQDAPATILAEARGSVTASQGTSLATVNIMVETAGSEPTVWVHIDVDRDGRVSKGDYVTTRSYAVPSGPQTRLEVAVNRV